MSSIFGTTLNSIPNWFRSLWGSSATQSNVPPMQQAEPPQPPGTVRFYHGSDSPTTPRSGWITPHRDYAANYYGDNTNLFYVDLPHGSPGEVSLRNWDDIDEGINSAMVGTYRHGVVPEAMSKLRPMTPPQVATRPPIGIMGREEALQRQQEGLTQPQD